MKEEEYWILMSKKITGEASAEELELLRKLINNNYEWKSIMENLQELWDSKPPEVANTDKHQENEDNYLTHINRLKKRIPDFKENDLMAVNEAEVNSELVKKPFYTRWVTYAASAVLIAGIILLYPIVVPKQTKKETVQAKPVNEIAINPGSRTKIQLPDGSQVWVNSGSKLTYEGNFKGNLREVRLDGEAYFDVVKDALHPFIVHTSGIDIKVLGTAFNVKAYKVDRTIEATLIHGSIEVINQNQPGAPKIMLKPHEKLIYSKYQPGDIKSPQEIKPVDDDPFSISIESLKKNIADSDIVETAWVYNKLSFEEERFADLVVKMERWYNVKINIENEKLMNYRISGSFVNETVEEAIKELQFLVPFKFSIKNNEIKIMQK